MLRILALCLGTMAAFPVAAGAEEPQSVGVVEAISIAVDAVPAHFVNRFREYHDSGRLIKMRLRAF
jgi:hypothetical protein